MISIENFMQIFREVVDGKRPRSDLSKAIPELIPSPPEVRLASNPLYECFRRNLANSTIKIELNDLKPGEKYKKVKPDPLSFTL